MFLHGKGEKPNDPRKPPSQWFLLILAVAIAVAVTVFAGLMIYLKDIWSARPLG